MNFIAARIIGTPLLIEPRAASAILATLADRLDIATIAVAGETLSPQAARARGREREPREYAVEDGVALVPVLGTLTSRSMSLQPASGMTGYDSIERTMQQAVADPAVRGILLEIDSPGGEAAGALEAARFIASLRGQKPIWAVASPQAASSAYALASAADRIIAPVGADVGSIGVLAVHSDLSGRLERKGQKVTIFQRGARKADGHPFGPMPQEAVDRFGVRMDQLYQEFAELVSANRKLSLNAIYSTEADTFSGPEALELGLIDAVLDPREALEEFRQHLNAGPPARSEGPPTMHTISNVHFTGTGTRVLDSMAQARMELAARFTSIMALPDAAGHMQPLAQHLALSTALSADEVAAVLAVAKKTAKPTTDFHEHMARLRKPDVGPDDGEDGDEVEGLLRRARAREGRL